MSQTTANRQLITLAASLGWFFDAYVITIYALSVPLIAREFKIPSIVLSGAVGSIFLVGYTIGTIGFGVYADIFGRRIMLGISIVAYAVVTALTSLANGLYGLAICRFLTGVGGGGELSVGSPYVTEVWPQERRGLSIGIMYAFYPAGYLFSELMFFLLTPQWGWRAVYIFALVPAFLILALRLRLEESPRFIGLIAQLQQEVGQRVGLRTALRTPTYRRLMSSGVLIFVSLTYSYYALAFYIGPYVIERYQLLATRGVIVVLALLASSSLIGGLAGGAIGDAFGRRKPAMIMSFSIMICTFAWWGGTWSLLMFCLFMMLTGLLGGALWSLSIVYVNELFPTEIRASGFGWSSGLGRVVSVGAPIVTQALAGAFGVAHAIAVSAFIWVPLLIGYLISHETVGTEISDRVLPMAGFEVVPE
jgi:MFS transporter, putative metabolite:H+ symporter